MKNKNLDIQLEKFWNKQLNITNKLLKANEAIGIVGLYGVGKRFFINYLIENILDGLIIKINLKHNKLQSNQDIYKLVIDKLKYKNLISNKVISPQTDFEFHYLIKETIKEHKKKIIIIFNESQQLLSLTDSFWDNLANLQFYQKKYLQLIFVGQPGFVNFSTESSNSLLQNNFIYIKPFNKTIIKELLKNENHEFSSKYENFLWKFSHGHYGTTKYLLRKLNLYKINHNSSKLILNKKLFNKLIKNDSLLPLWIKQVWSQITPEQQFIINDYLETGIINTKYYKLAPLLELIKLGLFYGKEKNISFFLEEFGDLIKNTAISEPNKKRHIFTKEDQIFIDNLNVSSIFSNEEQKAFSCLLNNNGEYVTYEQLGRTIWKQQIDDKYSLWALNKLISRLRKKLPKIGFSKKTIRTVRNRGYGWYNFE